MKATISIFIILLLVFFLTKKYNLNKNQKIIFWVLVLFWSGISIIRSYRKQYAFTPLEFGGLGLDFILASQITAGYGLISTFIRLPVFLLSDIFKQKKIFVQLSLIFLISSSILVYLSPSYNTLYFSSISLGICASMLSVFNVIFSETFKAEEVAISASILSVAPLLAEFIAAPIQYIATYNIYKNFNFLWLCSSIIAMITLYLSFKMVDLSPKNNFSIIKIKNVLLLKKFIYICIVGIFISFMKFSTSGANMITYAKTYLNMNDLMLAYLDTIFSSFQLLASVLVGTYFNKKISIEKILLLSIFINIIFYIISLINNNPFIFFISYSLNGFGYGGAYISLITIAMSYFDKEHRNISMGFFQGFFALGIFFGDIIYVFINLLHKLLAYNLEQNKFIFIITIIIGFISIILIKISEKFKN